MYKVLHCSEIHDAGAVSTEVAFASLFAECFSPVRGRGVVEGKNSHPTGKHLRPGTLALLKSSPAVARSGIISHFWLQGRKHFACRFMARPKPILNPPWEMHHTYMWVSLSVCVHPHACASFYGHTSFGFPRSPAFLFSNAFKLHLLCGLIKLSALDNLIVALKVVVKNHGSHKFQVGFIGEGLWLTALQNRDSENLKNMSFYNWKCVLKQMFKMPIKFCLWFANNSAFKMDIFPTLLLFPFVQFFFQTNNFWVSAWKLEVKSAMPLEFPPPTLSFRKIHPAFDFGLKLCVMALDLFAFHLLSTHAASLQLARPLASNLWTHATLRHTPPATHGPLQCRTYNPFKMSTGCVLQFPLLLLLSALKLI